MRVPWQAIVGTATVAGVVAGIVYGAADLLGVGGPSETDVPPDERLELVDFEYSAEPVRVTVLEYVAAGSDPTVSPFPEPPGDADAETEWQYPLVLTFRNPSDDPAILTGLKLVVHEWIYVRGCGSGPGPGVRASLNYDFRFPNTAATPWESVSSQNFSVDPHGVDALSVTVGPEEREDTIMVWRSSVYGESTGGKEAHLGDAVGMHLGTFTALEEVEDVAMIDYRRYILGEPELTDDDAIHLCASSRVAALEDFLDDHSADAVIHPGIDGMVAAYRELGAG